MKKETNFTEGSVLKSLVYLSIPIILANILQTAYQLTDMFWLGRLGAEAVASVSVSFPFIFFLISLGGGLAMAGTILVAQYKGKKDETATNTVAGQTLLMVLVVSCLLSIIGYSLSPFLLSLMGLENNIYENAVSYMQISFIGIVFMFGFFVYESLMRGLGEVRKPLLIVLFGVILNLFLDPLFIFGYGTIQGYGVSGAAIATIFTQGISAIIGIYLLFKGDKTIHIRKRNLKPNLELMKNIFSLGLPISIEQSARALGIALIVFLVAGFGTNAIAAYGIGGRIFSFILIPALGLSIATSTLVGQNLGAGKIERAEKVTKISMWIGFISLSLIGILLFIFAENVCAFFIPGEIETIKEGALFIRIMAPFFGFLALQLSLLGTFRGSGNTLLAMLISIISIWAIRFPIAFYLSQYTGYNEIGIWFSFSIADFLTAIIAIFFFIKGDWKKKKLTQEIKIQKKQ